jgi:hypothetical protein
MKGNFYMKMQFWLIFVRFIQSGRFKYNDNHFIWAEARVMWRFQMILVQCLRDEAMSRRKLRQRKTNVVLLRLQER